MTPHNVKQPAYAISPTAPERCTAHLVEPLVRCRYAEGDEPRPCLGCPTPCKGQEAYMAALEEAYEEDLDEMAAGPKHMEGWD